MASSSLPSVRGGHARAATVIHRESRGARVDVAELFPTRRHDRRVFSDLPFRLASEFDAWQPGVRMINEELIHPGRNPFWKRHPASFFAAMRDGLAVGRIAVIDPGSIHDLPNAAVVALPDFIDDDTVTTPLFEAVASRARERGAQELVGPFNPDIHHDVGIQISGHDRRNAIFMGFQPPYYQAHFERRGFQRLRDFAAWALYRETFIADGQLSRLAQRVERQRALRIRPVNLRQFADELKLFHTLYCKVFASHWGFSAPSWDEFRFIAGDLRHVLRPQMALVAEWNGTPAGFVLGVPDIYSILPKRTGGRLTPAFILELLRRWRHVDEVRVMIAGVLPEFRSHGIHLPLFYRVACEIFALGFHGGEISWVMTDNEGMTKALPLLGARPTKVYRVYQKRLHQ